MPARRNRRLPRSLRAGRHRWRTAAGHPAQPRRPTPADRTDQLRRSGVERLGRRRRASGFFQTVRADRMGGRYAGAAGAAATARPGRTGMLAGPCADRRSGSRRIATLRNRPCSLHRPGLHAGRAARSGGIRALVRHGRQGAGPDRLSAPDGGTGARRGGVFDFPARRGGQSGTGAGAGGSPCLGGGGRASIPGGVGWPDRAGVNPPDRRANRGFAAGIPRLDRSRTSV